MSRINIANMERIRKTAKNADVHIVKSPRDSIGYNLVNKWKIKFYIMKLLDKKITIKKNLSFYINSNDSFSSHNATF